MKKEKKVAQNLQSTYKSKLPLLAAGTLVFCVVLALVLYCIFCLDNLMHSDMAAEVNLARQLSDENKLITKNWFYSTEIRIVYSHLIMIPLFKIFSDYHLVKLFSIFIFYGILIWAYWKLSQRFQFELPLRLLVLALLFAPLSNEYLDMLLIGCFYTSQVICMYFVHAAILKPEKTEKKMTKGWIVLWIFALILGLSGLRYLACLYLPLLFAMLYMVFVEKDEDTNENYRKIINLLIQFASAAVGFLINKFYLATHYSFDTTSQVAFVPLADVTERFLTSLKLMVEFMGYRDTLPMMSPLGMVNVVKCVFLLLFIGIIICLWKNRMTLLTKMERFFLYDFIFLFLLNWYMLIFTDVLMQYRYWLPVYVMGIFLVGIFMQKQEMTTKFQKPALALFLGAVVLASLYGELWQDTKYNDCEKRYAYMDFLKKENYHFGYATFWNGPVTEYLSDGNIRVGNLGGKDGHSAPYEWLTPKSYYRKGFHKGKVFLLLARTEEAGMLKGDFTVMEDAKLVYSDEYYAIYEGQKGMYLFSD